MALLASNVLTLADLAKRSGCEGIDAVGELLSQTNEILDDMLWRPTNETETHKITQRTGLPVIYFRLLNQGVPPSKSKTAQVKEGTALMEAWSEVDKALADLEGNSAAVRLSEGVAFLEAMNQKMATTVFYGNASIDQEQFTGLAPRYSSLAAANGKNIIDAGGTGSDNTSIWLVSWGEQTCFGIFPKGTKAGLEHNDFGDETVETTNGIGGARMRAYRDQWIWRCGLALKDWRYVVRAANIDVSNLVADAGATNTLLKLMTKMSHRIPFMKLGKPVFYMNRTVFQYLDLQAYTSVSNGGGITYKEVTGQTIPYFRGIPIKIVDAILETEARVV